MATTGGPALQLAQQADADALLSQDPFALLVGMLLDQQIPMERAFAGPHTIASRIGSSSLDPQELAAYEPSALVALFSQPPAVHRFPAAMAERVQRLAQHIVSNYGGVASKVWTDAASGEQLYRRLAELPGFGEQKARIFVALLGKQLRIQPPGWREAAGVYGPDGTRRSVADVTDAASLEQVRAFKREQKRSAK